MTNKQMYQAYVDTRNPAMREWYAKTLNRRASLSDSEARIYAGKMHTPTKAGK